LNDLGVAPIAFFRHFSKRVRALSLESRYALALSISLADLRPLVSPEKHADLLSAFCFDVALRMVSPPSSNPSVLYSGSVRLNSSRLDDALTGPEIKHYIHHATNVSIHTCEISEEVSRLYELRGVPAVRVSSFTEDETYV
jgi:hypothetical protein